MSKHPPPPQAVGQPLIHVNGPRTALSSPKADIQLYYEDSTMNHVSAKCLLDRSRLDRTTYGCSDETTVGKFKLGLRSKATSNNQNQKRTRKRKIATTLQSNDGSVLKQDPHKLMQAEESTKQTVIVEKQGGEIQIPQQ